MKHPLSLAAFLVALGLAAAAFPDITDFRIPAGAEFNISGTPGRLAVTPDDRFVLILDETNKAVKVLDTWNWVVVNPLGSDTVALGATPSHIALNPQGNKAYVTLDNGKVAVVDISKLASLGFDQPLSTLSPVPTVIDSITISFTVPPTALGDIATVPMSGAASDSCVFVIDGDSLKWFKESAPQATPPDITPSNCLAREVEGGGGKYAYLRCDNDLGGNDSIEQIRCLTTGPAVPPNFSLLLSSKHFLGLSLAPGFEWLLTGDTTSGNEKLVILAADTLLPSLVQDGNTGVGAPIEEVLATDFAAESGPIAFTLDDTDLLLVQVSSTVDEFTGTPTSLTPPVTGGSYLARSSSADQYVYLSLAGGDTVAVVTANPWVEILSPASGDTMTTSDPIVFNSDKAGGYEIILTDTFKSSGTSLISGPVAAGGIISAFLDLTKLKEGSNILTVEVTAGGTRTGRDAIEVMVNLPPAKVNFSLDFGTQKIMVSFRALNVPDIDRYEIYYDTSEIYGETCGEITTTIDHKTIPSSEFDPGDEIKETIEGLENYFTYYVRIVAWDTSYQCSVSAQQSTLVEPVATLTDLAGEKGGFDCFGIGSGAGFWGSGAWLAAAPLGLLGLIKAVRKWRRRR